MENATSQANGTDWEMARSTKMFIFSLCIIIILVGVVGNLSVILVVSRVREMRKPVYYCLSSLAVSDTLLLCIVTLVPLATLFGLPGGIFGRDFCRFSAFFDRGAIVASVLTVLMISVERYLAVCHPLKARYVLTTKRTLITILGIWVLSLGVSIPYMDMVIYREHVSNNVTFMTCYFDDRPWQIWYEFVVTCTLFFLPVFILVILYIIMIRTIIRETGNQKEMSNNQSREVTVRKTRQVIFMLTGVVSLFVIGVLPYHVLTVTSLFFYETVAGMDASHKQGILWFCRIMTYINCAGNPVIYNVVSSEYRKALRKALGLIAPRRIVLYKGVGENGYMQREMTMSSYSL